MTSWTAALKCNAVHPRETGTIPLEYAAYTTNNWFPSDGVIAVSDKGSMTMELLPMFIRHFNRNARRYVNSGESIVITIDGHRSRNGVEWLQLCQQFSIEVVQAPANTTHFLQPCDSHILKSFKSSMRRLRDAFCTSNIMDTRAVNFKLAVGLAGYRGIKPWIVRKSFEDVGLFPMDYRFLNKFKKNTARSPGNIGENLTMSKEMGTDGSNTSEISAWTQRIPDRITADKVRNIAVAYRNRPSEMLELIATEMSNAQTANANVKSVEQPRSGGDESSLKGHRLLRVNPSGSGALCLTRTEHVQMLVEKKKAEEHKRKEIEEKRAQAAIRKKNQCSNRQRKRSKSKQKESEKVVDCNFAREFEGVFDNGIGTCPAVQK